MLNPPYGLRFDIYERVHLPEDVPAISELEEIELYPRIQVISEQEHAALRGHLLLSGIYQGENNLQEELSHQIPVEITIPLSRISSIDDIAVEIENFDVDLLSTRSLNITGVLSLRGIEGIGPAEDASEWNPEEFTVVHSNSAEEEESAPNPLYAGYNPYHRDPAIQDVQSNSGDDETGLEASEEEKSFLYTPYEPSGSAIEPKEEEVVWTLPYEAQSVGEPAVRDESLQETSYYANEEYEIANADSSEQTDRGYNEPADSYADLNSAQEERNNQESPAPEVWSFEPASVPAAEREATSAAEREATSSAEPVESSALPQLENAAEESSYTDSDQESVDIQRESAVLLEADVPQPEAGEEKPELKVAFGSKKSNDSSSQGSYGITSLIQKNKAPEEVLQLEDQLPIQQRDEEPTEEVQWKNLFLGSGSEQTPFKKVKLCIVQREETLETIADRYQLSTRELQLYNRLSEQSVEEGQVLYIP
ncbi:LysM peptidoglycan-binding domain-containing protein [Neobacillus mesonae]|nr:LysM peptidoglycan-binding domain-containing protein [Neobacillus mesonae]